MLTVVLTCFIEVEEKSRIFDTLGDDNTLFRVGLFVSEDSFQSADGPHGMDTSMIETPSSFNSVEDTLEDLPSNLDFPKTV